MTPKEVSRRRRDLSWLGAGFQERGTAEAKTRELG